MTTFFLALAEKQYFSMFSYAFSYQCNKTEDLNYNNLIVNIGY